jgi:hypothetical protein
VRLEALSQTNAGYSRRSDPASQEAGVLEVLAGAKDTIEVVGVAIVEPLVDRAYQVKPAGQ